MRMLNVEVVVTLKVLRLILPVIGFAATIWVVAVASGMPAWPNVKVTGGVPRERLGTTARRR
jgi:hypothetical protein